MIYIILLNGKVVGTTNDKNKAEGLRVFAERVCKTIAETSGTPFSWVVEVEIWDEFE